jgi:hypothetical protein
LKPEEKFLFLWIPKTAGMSMNAALGTGFRKVYKALENQPQGLNASLKGVTFYHSSISAMIAEHHVSQEWVNSAFKFAFVRNPWDRLVSLYYWLGHHTGGEKGLFFDEYIRMIAGGNCYEPPGLMNIRGLYQANRMVDWLRPDGNWLPDFIGRFENLPEEWRIIQKILDCKIPLVKGNSTQHAHYRDYYNDESRDLVAKRFEEDIDIFKYTF